MLKSILSEGADMVLDMGLTAVLGNQQVDLSEQTFKRLQNLMEDQEIKWRLMPRLHALTKRVRTYLNGGGTDEEGLKKIRGDALDLSEAFAAHKTRRDAVQPYHLSKAIHVAAIRRALTLGVSGSSPADLGDAGLDAANVCIQFEQILRTTLTDYAYSAFKHYTLTSRATANWFRALPSETRGDNHDPMAWLGSRYREVLRGFLKAMKGREGELIARPAYVVKMVRPSKLAFRGVWIDAGDASFFRCEPTRGGFVPIGDAFGKGKQPRLGVPYVKPLRRKVAWVEDWHLRWDDRSADKNRDDDDPRDERYQGGPWGFWTPKTPRGWTAIGHMIEKIGRNGRPDARRPRIQMFPEGDLVEGWGEGVDSHWSDSGSRADKDVCAHRIFPKSENFNFSPRICVMVTGDGSGRAQVGTYGGGSYNPENVPFRWLKKELLDGY